MGPRSWGDDPSKGEPMKGVPFGPCQPDRNQPQGGHRGGWCGRRSIGPGDAPVWVSSGRWGRRRARVAECVGVVRAEDVYAKLLTDSPPGTVGPGWRGHATFTLASGEGGERHFRIEVRANPVWRMGRVFLRCPACDRRATRLYVPVADADLRCRRCWGLSYESQSWSYRSEVRVGALVFPLNLCRHTTQLHRDKRRQAARLRYAARRRDTQERTTQAG